MKRKPSNYEAQLTEGEREQLYVWLSQPALSLEEIARRAPVWRTGRFAGKRPTPPLLSKLAARVRLETALLDLQTTSAVETGLREKMMKVCGPGRALDGMLDEIMTLIGNEVKKRTIENLDPQARTAAAKLLLKRSDQKLNREKFNWTKKMFRAETKALREKNAGDGQTAGRDGAITKETWERIEKELKLL